MAQKNRFHLSAEKNMRALGLYKPEFDEIIAVYASLMWQYDALSKKFRKDKYQHEVPTSAGMKKAPIVTTMESLRKDILTYANALGLTPMGLLKANDKAFEKKKASGLTEALKEMDGRGG